MERLQGKLIESDGFDTFVKDFVEWAGSSTATAVLELESTGMSITAETKRNSDTQRITAKGLAGGGEAVAMWLEAEGYEVVRNEPNHVTIEVDGASAGTASQDLARFLSPAGRWRLLEVTARRQA